MTERETQRTLESIAIALNRIASCMEKDQQDAKDFRLAIIDAVRSLKETEEDDEK